MTTDSQSSDDQQAAAEAQDLIDKLNFFGQSFQSLCVERHNEGQYKYGKFTFLENDVIRMMLEELADTVNYCNYQAVKLMLLQEALEAQVEGSGLLKEGQQEITIGVQAFKGTKDVGWNKS